MSFCSIALLLCFAATASALAQDEIPNSSDPVLISVSDSTRALAANANTFRGALPKKNAEVFQPGARAIVFVTNIDLMADEAANAFRVYAEDARGTQYRLTVENIHPVRKMDWVYALTVRLYDENGRFKANVGTRPLRADIDAKSPEQLARELPEVKIASAANASE